jgi:hypothetical protein
MHRAPRRIALVGVVYEGLQVITMIADVGHIEDHVSGKLLFHVESPCLRGSRASCFGHDECRPLVVHHRGIDEWRRWSGVSCNLRENDIRTLRAGWIR